MSSLRVESVRLCWLEAFIAVADAENISSASCNLGLSQPTVSRYIQRLEAWTGKKLIEISRIKDPEDPGVNVLVTEAGQEFYNIAVETCTALSAFRTDEAKRKERLEQMGSMLLQIQEDLEGPAPTHVASELRENIKTQRTFLNAVASTISPDQLEPFYRAMCRIFVEYEQRKKRELAARREKKRSTISPASLRVPNTNSNSPTN